MKAIFCAYDRPGHIASGPNVWLKRLIPDLITAGLDIRTLFIHSGDESECPTIRFFRTNQMEISVLSSTKKPYIEDQIRWILREMKSFHPDMLVANLVAPAFYIPIFVKNIPVIAVLHSHDPFYTGVVDNFFSEKSKYRLDGIVAVSNYIKNFALSKNKGGLIKKISCGAPIPSFKAKFESDKLRVLYVGRITEEAKQISKMTKSFCLLAQINSCLEFSIYGDGPAVDNVLSIITQYKVQDRVKYHPSVEPDKVQEIMATHQVFTLMSDYEGLPVALLEAMSCGLVPVCLSEPSGINEVIRHGENGFIVEDREESYYSAISQLAQDKIMWQRMSESAVKTIIEEYSASITHQKWADFIINFPQNQAGKKIRVPLLMNFSDIPPLYYGDYRKPPFWVQLKKRWRQYWISLRFFIRPRSRLRSLMQLIPK